MPAHLRFKKVKWDEPKRALFRIATAMEAQRQVECSDDPNAWTQEHVDVRHRDRNKHSNAPRDKALMSNKELWIHALVVNAKLRSKSLSDDWTVFEAVINKYTYLFNRIVNRGGGTLSGNSIPMSTGGWLDMLFICEEFRTLAIQTLTSDEDRADARRLFNEEWT